MRGVGNCIHDDRRYNFRVELNLIWLMIITTVGHNGRYKNSVWRCGEANDILCCRRLSPHSHKSQPNYAQVEPKVPHYVEMVIFTDDVRRDRMIQGIYLAIVNTPWSQVDGMVHTIKLIIIIHLFRFDWIVVDLRKLGNSVWLSVRDQSCFTDS